MCKSLGQKTKNRTWHAPGTSQNSTSEPCEVCRRSLANSRRKKPMGRAPGFDAKVVICQHTSRKTEHFTYKLRTAKTRSYIKRPRLSVKPETINPCRLKDYVQSERLGSASWGTSHRLAAALQRQQSARQAGRGQPFGVTRCAVVLLTCTHDTNH